MGEQSPGDNIPPLEVSASLDSDFVGESPLLAASRLLHLPGYTYKTYLPAPDEQIGSVVEGVAALVEKGTMVVTVTEGIPLVALPGDNAESIQDRWRLLKLLTTEVAIEEIEPLPERSPEELHQEIGTELLRIFKRPLELYQPLQRTETGTKMAIDWTTQRSIQSFSIRGEKVPDWLCGRGLSISTDGKLIKIETARDVHDWDKEGPIHIGVRSQGGSDLQPIDEPLVFNRQSDDGGENAGQRHKRSKSRGYAYRDVEDDELSELLRVMRHLPTLYS